MAPTFRADQFKFEDGQIVPEHVEDDPSEEALDPTKIWLEGVDVSTGDVYPLAIDVDDMPTANVLMAARLRQLEEVQPVSSSSESDSEGPQYGVFINEPRPVTTRDESIKTLFSAEELQELFGRNPDSFLGTKEVARLFQQSERSIADLAKKGKIPHVRTLGGHYRFKVGSMKKLYEDLYK